MELREYVNRRYVSPFRVWFDRLDAQAAAKVVVALDRLTSSNTSSLKNVGAGVSECRIHWGPGYRVYVAHDGVAVIVLLGGGTKQRQQDDIADAQKAWQDYKKRRQEARRHDTHA